MEKFECGKCGKETPKFKESEEGGRIVQVVSVGECECFEGNLEEGQLIEVGEAARRRRGGGIPWEQTPG